MITQINCGRHEHVQNSFRRNINIAVPRPSTIEHTPISHTQLSMIRRTTSTQTHSHISSNHKHSGSSTANNRTHNSITHSIVGDRSNKEAHTHTAHFDRAYIARRHTPNARKESDEQQESVYRRRPMKSVAFFIHANKEAIQSAIHSQKITTSWTNSISGHHHQRHGNDAFQMPTKFRKAKTTFLHFIVRISK